MFRVLTSLCSQVGLPARFSLCQAPSLCPPVAAPQREPGSRRTPRRDPASAPTARFLGMPVCVEWGAISSARSREGRSSSSAWPGSASCLLQREAGAPGVCSQPCGLKRARPHEGLSAHRPIRPRGSAVCQLSSVIIESSLSWNVISLGVSGLRGMPQSLCRAQLPFYLQN